MVLGCVSFCVSLVTLLLPETKNWPLPQSIADVHNYSAGNYTKKTDSTVSKELEAELDNMLSLSLSLKIAETGKLELDWENI